MPELPEASEPVIDSAEPANTRWVAWSSLVITLLQSACTAVIAISGIRVAIGLSSLAAVAGLYTPSHGWHADIIRVPLLAIALLGSLVNLYVITKIWRLRNRASAQWRRKTIDRKKLRSERLQFALSLVTLLLIAVEWLGHSHIHRVALFH